MFTKKALALVAGVLATLAIVSTQVGYKAEAASTQSAPSSTAARKQLSSEAYLLSEEFAKQAVFIVMQVRTDNHNVGGTGFLADTREFDKVIVTNRHVCGRGNLVRLLQGSSQWTARIIARSRVADLCLVKAPRDLVREHLGYPLASEPIAGSSIRVYGHPGLEPLSSIDGNYLNTTREPIRISGFEDFIFSPDTMMAIGLLNIEIYPGASGSPALNNRGQVVAIIFGYQGEVHQGLSVPVTELHKFLETLE